MSEQDFQPSKYTRDFSAWHSELPYELQFGQPKEADPLDALWAAELADHDRELVEVIDHLGRLRLGFDIQASHTLWKTEGYTRLGVTGLTESERYNNKRCMLVIYANVVNDVFAPVDRRNIHLENYFIDSEHALISLESADIGVERGTLPADAPYMYWRLRSDVVLEHGKDHAMVLPKNEDLSFDDVHDARQAIKLLRSRIVTFDTSTFDD
jgi:hypothetical protein